MAAYLMKVAATIAPPPELRGTGSLVSSSRSSNPLLRPMCASVSRNHVSSLHFLTSLYSRTTFSPKSDGLRHPVGPRPDYLSSFFGAAAAKVQGELFCLFARLRVDHDLAYRYPAVVAGVGAQALEAGVVRVYSVVEILSSGWV